MTVVTTVLHPENDPTVDLHPETDAGQVTDFLNKTYPVNSIFMSVDSTSPASLFGGTWTRIQNGFLLSAGYNSIANGTTGGSKDAIVPYHRHLLSSDPTSNYLVGSDSNPIIQAKTGEETRGGFVITASYNTLPAVRLFVNRTAVDYIGTSGNTVDANMPPYLAVYMWKRVA